jgi:glycosyltransferase involved in cell wall biosynthesis
MNSPPLIVLVNLNEYLGGGETLMVRFAEYLQRKGADFICVCATGSYAFSDLKRKGISSASILTIDISPDYFYSSRVDREILAAEINSKILSKPACLVSFCMRDLYTTWGVSATLSHVKLVHLILHIQDDLYVGQTVLERITYKLTGRRHFSNSQAINFNRWLLETLNENGALICMADVISQAWRKNFGIAIAPTRIVPLPSFVAPAANSAQEQVNHKIIWIGRLVDFKIPALLAMVDFLGTASKYQLTIVGDGDRGAILARMKERRVSADRVNFVGEVSYAELEKVICGHSIGYAMGTSLIELARFRIPVVIALASYAHVTFRRPICGGLFFDQPRGCDGSELSIRSEDEIATTIKDAMRVIENDWKLVADSCYAYARDNYSAEENFAAYKAIIENSRYLSDKHKATQIPTAPFSRRFFYTFKKWFT